MSGFEIAGLVLGGFPIILKCLEEYRRVFEPLDEWWHFNHRFIDFVDDVRHQGMLFHANMIQLLDPIVPVHEDLLDLADNPGDPRWQDRSLTRPLRSRLGSEMDRLIRCIQNIHQGLEYLKGLLLIQDAQVAWLSDKSLQWHFNRLRLAFDKKKFKKVKVMERNNQEFGEILGCSERLLAIATKRGVTSTERLDKVRQHTLSLFNALCKIWSCNRCQDHQANLKLRHDAAISELEMLLVVRNSGGDASACSDVSLKVCVRRELDSTPGVADIQSVPGACLLSNMQVESGQRSGHQNDCQSPARGWRETLKRKGPSITLPWKKVKGNPPTPGPATPLPTNSGETNIPLQTFAIPTPPPSAVVGIQNLCLFLGDSAAMKGTFPDEDNHQFELTKNVQPSCSTTTARMSLHEILDAYRKHMTLELPRRIRFQMAAHIASALLQTNESPWLPENWTKHSFYFLADRITGQIESSHAFVSRSFPARPADHDTQPSVDMTHHCLKRVGIIIMELVYGVNIEDSSPYLLLNQCGATTQDIHLAAARMWQCNLVSESGPPVAQVVLKCLTDYGFGQSPSLGNPKFRKALYEQVIEPLVNYRESWDLGPED